MKHFPLQATWNALQLLQTLCWAMEIRSSHVSWCHGDGIDVLFFEHFDHWPRLRVEGRRMWLGCYRVCSAVPWPCAGHSPLWEHGSLAAWAGEPSCLWALAFPQVSQAEIVLYKSLVHLHANVLISLLQGPCTFGVSEDETFHTSNFLRFIHISSLQLCDF